MQKVKRIISEQLKEEMTISHQIENTNKEIKKIRKKEQIEIYPRDANLVSHLKSD